jgi:hypothetical protein
MLQLYPSVLMKLHPVTEGAQSGRPRCQCITGRHATNFFGDRVISKDLWPTRSVDLTPPDVLPSGFHKGKFYTNKPRTIDGLKENIRQETAAMSANMLRRVFASLEHHVQLCMDTGDGHFHHVTGYSFTGTEGCNYSIWSPSVHE